MSDCRMEIAYIDPDTYTAIVNHDMRRSILNALFTYASQRPVTKAELAELLDIKYQQLVYQLGHHLQDFWIVEEEEKVRGARREFISPSRPKAIYITLGKGGRLFVVDPLADRYGPVDEVGLRCDGCEASEFEACLQHLIGIGAVDMELEEGEKSLLAINGRRPPYRPLDHGIISALRGMSRGDRCVIEIPCQDCAFMVKHLIQGQIGDGMDGDAAEPTRFLVLGGFLGAGKTTLAINLARTMRDKFDRSVAIITNDQGDVLVDTEFTKEAGFDVKEILGGCFCAKFSDFVKSARTLVSAGRPDVIIAEPIGTSTNLLASVITPLRTMYPDEFQVAPFTIVVDGTHAMDIIEGGRSSDAGVELIPAHQVKEAEYIIVSKCDRLRPEQVDRVTNALRELVPDAKVIPYSSQKMLNIDPIVSMVLSDEVSVKGSVGDENALFASEKAKLGWYSSTWTVTPEARLDLHRLTVGIMKHVSTTYPPESITHVKVSLSSDDVAIKMSLVYDSLQLDGLRGSRFLEGEATLVLNARVVSPPSQLREVMRESLESLSEPLGFMLQGRSESCFTPKPEAPSYFFED